MFYTSDCSQLPWRPSNKANLINWWNENLEGLFPDQSLHQTTLTGTVDGVHMSATMAQYLCFQLIGRISQENIFSACQALADVYTWQLEKTAWVEPVRESGHVRIANVKRVVGSPFVFEEE